MRRVTKYVACLAIGLSTLTVALPEAQAKPKITWARVDVPDDADAPKLTKALKQLLNKAVKKANFGKAKNVTLSVRVVEFTTHQQGDVLRVNCTVMGRV